MSLHIYIHHKIYIIFADVVVIQKAAHQRHMVAAIDGINIEYAFLSPPAVIIDGFRVERSSGGLGIHEAVIRLSAPVADYAARSYAGVFAHNR